MADSLPPDTKKVRSRRGGTSGKVADFRYKSPPRAKGADVPRTAAPAPRTPARNSGANGGLTSQNRSGQSGTRSEEGGGGAGPRVANGGPRPGQAYAALDLGTNNCRLLIARPSGEHFTVIDAFSRVVRLGEGVSQTGSLSEAAMARTMTALHVCAEKLRRRNVYLARSVATEACRRASNGAAFIERVRQETGIALDIISAQEEARLAVLGCHILLERGSDPAVIFDIGGGSTELVLVEPSGVVPRILDWQSVPWGVVSLTDTVGPVNGPPEQRAARYAAMRETVRTSFARFAARIAPHGARATDPRLLGTSGTVTTLASVHLGLPQYNRQAIDGLVLPSAAMRAVSERLAGMAPEERAKLPCIGDDRANLVVAGCAILESILDIWPAARLGVSDRGIREGILRSLMAADRPLSTGPDVAA